MEPASQQFTPKSIVAMEPTSSTTPQLYHSLDPPRNEIRVLVLEPGPPDSKDLLTGTLIHTSLAQPSNEGADKLSYETISYAWGDSSLRALMRLNGHAVSIPRSSEAALRRMRLDDKARYLWCDAICINQADLAERSSQVGIMAEVYSQGTRNLVYLGEDEEFMERALESIKLLLDTELVEVVTNKRSIFEYERDRQSNRSKYQEPMLIGLDYEALGALYSRPWFSRLWVLQEAAMAQESHCYCGKFEVPLTDVLLVGTWIGLQYQTFALAPVRDALMKGTITTILTCMKTPHSWYNMFQDAEYDFACYLMQACRGFATSEPLDKVFAIWGLINAAQKDQTLIFQIDYTMSLADAMTQAWAHAMTMSPRPYSELNWILHRSTEDIHVAGLPSWVPRSYREWEQYDEGMGFALIFSASGGIETRPHFSIMLRGSKTSGTMRAQGFLIDDVVDVFSTDPARKVFEFMDFKEDYVLPLQTLLDGQIWENERVVLLLTAGSWHDSGPIAPLHVEACKKFLGKFCNEEYLPSWSSLELGSDADDETKSMAECALRIEHICQSRRIYRTRRRLLVLGPQVGRSGDIIVQLLGMRTPCVLRPCGECFEFLGAAYVHGAMHGESVKEWQDAGGLAETYTLI